MPNPHDAPIVAGIASLAGGDMLRFITKQRWFAAKGAAPTRADVSSCIVLPWGDGRFAITRVAVSTRDGEATYQVPLATRATLPDVVDDRFVVASSDTGSALVYDAMHDPEFRAGLAAALAHGAVARDAGTAWMIDPVGVAWLPDVAQPVSTRVSSAEQSNTSVVIGDRTILKLFRTLKAGVQPDVEVTEFLTNRAGFANTPRLLATIRFDDGSERTTAGMLQEFLPGSSDAWSYALERGRSYFTAPPGRDAPNTFVADAARLGAITRAMHDALASDDNDADFAPEPITPEDLERWAHRTQQSIRDALALLARQLTSRDFPSNRRAEAEALVGRRDHYTGWIDEIVDNLAGTGGDGMRTRIHGDYHLGQVLRAATGDFMIIDFEGEPSKPLSERREKTSPLRDVAGMLRSIAYAAATLATSVEKTVDVPRRELRTARWERDVRQAFLDAYLGEACSRDELPEFLPEDDDQIRQLLAMFETEKAFYELAYELNNRPAWAWIPMRGIAKLFVSRS